jgi:hypothetical protein
MAAWQFVSRVPRYVDSWKFAVDRLEGYLRLRPKDREQKADFTPFEGQCLAAA